MWAYMVVGDISKFFHGLIQFIFRSEFIKVCAFVFQRVEVPFHWRIVVRISGFIMNQNGKKWTPQIPLMNEGLGELM